MATCKNVRSPFTPWVVWFHVHQHPPIFRSRTHSCRCFAALRSSYDRSLGTHAPERGQWAAARRRRGGGSATDEFVNKDCRGRDRTRVTRNSPGVDSGVGVETREADSMASREPAWHRPTCNNMLVNFRAAFDLDECGDEARLAWKTIRAPQLKGRSCGKIGKRALLHREESPGDVIAEG